MKLPIKDIKTNPKNPRLIKDDKFKKLVQSLKDFPEMADVREIVVNKDHVVLGGNMRLKAMQEAGWTEAPVKVVDWSQDKQDEFVVKDNASFGEWDWEILANEWNAKELNDWGIDFNKIGVINSSDENSEWVGMPDFEPREDTTKIIIQFQTEEERDAYIEETKLKISTKAKNTWSTWWPYKERANLLENKYE